jgi:SNF2 family DNA or RNA helicase
MSSSLLEKLKSKPKPAVVEQVAVRVAPRKKVEIKDKRREKLVNRDELLRAIMLKRPQPMPQPERVPAPAPMPQPERVPAPAPAPGQAPVIRKKKGKKLRIVGIEKGTISTVPPKEPEAPKPRISKKPDMGVIIEGKQKELVVGQTIKADILPAKKPQVIVRASEYYLNNRQIFVSFINKLFQTYREQILKEREEAEVAEGEDLLESKCSKKTDSFLEFELLTHQKIVRDYLNLYTPYRGLLLYHGLGSGKTCSSIAIAEGMKSEKQIIVMTPASLRRNYIEQLKECGDPLYVKNQYWKFVSLKSNEHLLHELASTLSLSKDFIRANDGAWMVNVQKESNYESLSTQDKNNLDKQLNEMIRNKYQFINYNGMRTAHLDKMSKDGTMNPFDNAVIIIDEAHNFISRIVNKINKPDALSMRLYEFLMTAQNARVVLLSGTPIINYPNEIGILFNILRGYIKTWTMPLNVKTSEKVNEATIKKILSSPEMKGLIDYVDYRPSTKQLKITRNPFGFVGVTKGRSYKGVTLSDDADISDERMISLLESALKNNKIDIIRGGITVNRYKALPDRLEDFQTHFVNIKTGDIKNKKLFQRRILGLVSYFADIKDLMPRYDIDKDLHVLRIPMSDYQFGTYEEARVQERKLERRSKTKKKSKPGKDGLYDDSVSTYRIFSRAFCNFVFPRTIGRPMPQDGTDIETVLENTSTNEDTIDAVSISEKVDNPESGVSIDDIQGKEEDKTYEARIKQALALLRENASEYLTPDALMTYSPKFLMMYENIIAPENEGLHMMYSQFRTLEGIGIFSLILEANGFSKFKLRKNATTGLWELNMTDEELKKPTFALYTGTEENEEKEIIRNIYNSDWGSIPTSIAERLKSIHGDNVNGEIIKLLMITASGAEGISLKNCRFVHITEPYWHPVRVEQVIGRAARICSHKDLPPAMRNVKVFMYLMTFSEKQLKSDESIELRLKDKSKVDKKTPLTSDEALFEISNLKNEINKKILTAVKEAAIDCSLHSGADSKEPLVCFSFGKTEPSASKFAITPSLDGEEADVVAYANVQKITWKAKELKIAGKLYALKEDTGELYEYQSYLNALQVPGVDPRYVGKLNKRPDGTFAVELVA